MSSSSDVEKREQAWRDIGFELGRASRDTEIAELRQAQQEQWYQNDVGLKAANDAFRERVAELDAVIEKVREWDGGVFRTLAHVLDAAPSSVLADRDADKWDEGAEAGFAEAEYMQPPTANPYRRRAVEED